MALYLVFCKTEAPYVSASSCRNFFLRYDKSDSAKSEPQNAASPDTESPSLWSVKFDTRSRIPFSRLPIVPAIKVMQNIETRRRNRGILDEGEEKKGGKRRLSQFLFVADVRNGTTGSRPVSEHAYSIYGYFLYGWPFPPPWEPIGTSFYTNRRNVNSEKENTGITTTFYRSHILLPNVATSCKIFILFTTVDGNIAKENVFD